LEYDTGEQIFVRLAANGVEANLKLECRSLSFTPTYIGLAQRQTISIHNNSDIKAKFAWKIFPSPPTLEDIQAVSLS